MMNAKLLAHSEVAVNYEFNLRKYVYGIIPKGCLWHKCRNEVSLGTEPL